MIDEVCSLLDSILIHRRNGLVTADEVHLLGFILHHRCLSILRKVEHHRTWTTCTCDIERTAHCPCHIFSTTYLIAPLGDWVGHIDHIDLLKCICTQHSCSYLTAYHHHRGRIDHRISHTCDGVCCTWSAGHDGTSHLARHTRITLRCMNSTLLVTDQNVIQSVCIVVESIINWHDSTTWIAEKCLNTFVQKRTHQRLCSCYLFFHDSSLSSISSLSSFPFI